MKKAVLKRVLRETAVLFYLQALTVGSSAAATKKATVMVARNDVSAPTLTREKLLENSQVSYRADGGFTGVKSYGVIISCVHGKISVLKTLHDPRLPGARGQMRQTTTLDAESYLKLWGELERHSILQTRDAAMPKEDIAEEFTVDFNARVGEKNHVFKVYGIERPEASRYFVLRKLIDERVQMRSLWNAHQALVRRLGQPELTSGRLSTDQAY